MAHRHPPTDTFSPIVGNVYPIQMYFLENAHSPTSRRAHRHPPTDLYSPIVAGVLPSPCFPNFLARTTFVLETLPEAKIPGQDAFFGGHRHKTNWYPPQRLAIKVQYKEFCHISRGREGWGEGSSPSGSSSSLSSLGSPIS